MLSILAIYNNETLPNSKHYFAKIGSKLCPKLNRPSKNGQSLFNIVEFCQIWSHLGTDTIQSRNVQKKSFLFSQMDASPCRRRRRHFTDVRLDKVFRLIAVVHPDLYLLCSSMQIRLWPSFFVVDLISKFSLLSAIFKSN